MGATIAQWIRLHFNPAAKSLSPKHTIYTFINLLNCIMLKRRK